MRIETAKRETKSLALANTTRAIGDDVWQASETKPQSSKPLFSRTRELHIVVRDGAETQRIAMWRLLSRVRYSVTEESRLQSILAISVVSTKNSSLRSQSHFDYDEATIR
jgi:hypothetical protein